MSIIQRINEVSPARMRKNEYAKAKTEGMDIKDIASAIRRDLKRHVGKCKFLVKIERSNYGMSGGVYCG